MLFSPIKLSLSLLNVLDLFPHLNVKSDLTIYDYHVLTSTGNVNVPKYTRMVVVREQVLYQPGSWGLAPSIANR